MRKYNKFRPKKKVYGKKKVMSATSKAYWRGFKAGKRMARVKRRWYRWQQRLESLKRTI